MEVVDVLLETQVVEILPEHSVAVYIRGMRLGSMSMEVAIHRSNE